MRTHDHGSFTTESLCLQIVVQIARLVRVYEGKVEGRFRFKLLETLRSRAKDYFHLLRQASPFYILSSYLGICISMLHPVVHTLYTCACFSDISRVMSFPPSGKALASQIVEYLDTMVYLLVAQSEIRFQ